MKGLPCEKKEISYADGCVVYVFAIAANLVMQFAVSIFGSVIGIAAGDENFLTRDYPNLIAMILLQVAFIAVPVIYCLIKKNRKPALYAPFRKPAPADSLALLLPILTMVGFILPTYLFVGGLVKIGYTQSAGINTDTPGKMILAVLVMVIIAPTVEEIIFRGFLYGGLRKRYNRYVSALLAALAFSLMHMNPEQTVYQFCLGFACCMAAEASGNLWCPIAVHAGSNLIALFGGDLLGRGVEFIFGKGTAAVVLTAVALAIVCGALVWLVCFGIGKLGKNERTRSSERSGEAATSAGESVAETAESAVPNAADAARRKSERMVGTLLYVAGLGLCVFMWMVVFVTSMIL